MASGRPSSRRQISATASAFSLVSSKPGAAASARSTNSRTEAYCRRSASGGPQAVQVNGVGSGATGNSCSPLSRSTVRLVTSTTSPAAAVRSSATSGAATVTCSKLSSSSTTCRARRYVLTSAISGPPEVLSLSPAAMAATTRSACRTGAKSTKRTSWAKLDPSRPATSSASQLLPTPPGPVRVTRRTPSRSTSSLAASASRSRPTNSVVGAGSADAAPPAPGQPRRVPSRSARSAGRPGRLHQAAALPDPRSAGRRRHRCL